MTERDGGLVSKRKMAGAMEHLIQAGIPLGYVPKSI